MPKDALHQLIHSLSTFEKGYYIKSKGDSHLTILFNAINKMEKYERAVLEKRLSKHPKIIRYLAKYKNDTYTDIMRVMRSYRQEKELSVDMRLRVYLTDIVFLIERGLYENAMKLVRDAKKLARKYERYEVILEIIHYEIDLSKRLYHKGYIEVTRTLIEEEKKIMSILNDEQRYNEILHLMKLVYNRNASSGKQSHSEYLKELVSDELLVNEKRAISFISQYHYYQIHALYSNLMGNWQESYEYQKKNLDCWDAHPHQKQEDFLSYVSHVGNFMNTCMILKKYTIFEQLFPKIKKDIKPRNSYEKAIVFERIYFVELHYYSETGNFDKLDAFSAEIRSGLEKYSKAMATTSISAFERELNYGLFVMNKYEQAFEGFSKMIEQKLSTRIDFQCFAWLFKLIIAYELEYDNFSNLYRAAQRFFDKIGQQEIRKAYSLFMEFLHRVSRSPSSETKALFVEYQSILKQLYDNDKSKGLAIGHTGILTWIEYMITKESQIKIYKKLINSIYPDKVSAYV